MALNSPGIGSGLDVKSLVNQLVAASAQGPTLRFNRQEAQLQAEISGLGALKSALSEFQSALSGANDLSTYTQKSATNSESGILSVTASSAAAVGSYSINVTTLAASQKLASKAFTDSTSSIGTGTLTFRFGTYDSGGNTFTANSDKATQAVTIDSSNDSLQGIRDAVNDANIGVTATIINDGTGDRIVFTSNDTGAANSLEITVSGDSVGNDIDDNGLSQLAYDPTAAGVGTGKNLEEKVTATDAEFSIDGIDITSDSNTITGAIEGVTLDLKEADGGVTNASVKITENRSAITDAVNDFIEAYNKLVDTSNKLSSYNAETGEAGVLLGDATLRSVTSQVRRLLSDSVEGLSGSYSSLINLGIKTTEGGKLSLDETKLNEALDDDFNNVARVFAAAGNASDSLIDINSFSDETKVGSYAVNIAQLATQGNYTGAASSSLTIDANNDTFTITVDGSTSATITLTAGTYASEAELVAEIQSQIDADDTLKDAGVSVSVSHNGTGYVFSSDSYGSDSTVTIASVDTNTEATLGFSTGVGTSTDGLDVAGTIGGVTATGSGQTLTGSGNASGLSIEITGGTTGDRGIIDYTRGIADTLDDLLTSLLDSDGIFSSRTESLNDRIEDINDQRAALNTRLAALEARYLRQFNAMDALVAQLQSTSNFLFQQLSSTPFAQLSNG